MRYIVSFMLVFLAVEFAAAQEFFSDRPSAETNAMDAVGLNPFAAESNQVDVVLDVNGLTAVAADVTTNIYYVATNVVTQGQALISTNEEVTARVRVLLEAGSQYAEQGDLKEAEMAYLRALDVDPENDDLRFRLSALYVQIKNYQKAAELMEALAEKFPENALLQNNLAWLYATGGEMKSGPLALRHARQAIVMQPKSHAMWNTLAEAYYMSGDYDKALRASEYAVEILVKVRGSKEDIAAYAAQADRIRRAKAASKRFLGVDDDE